jgi:hypothetical protein
VTKGAAQSGTSTKTKERLVAFIVLTRIRCASVIIIMDVIREYHNKMAERNFLTFSSDARQKLEHLEREMMSMRLRYPFLADEENTEIKKRSRQ